MFPWRDFPQNFMGDPLDQSASCFQTGSWSVPKQKFGKGPNLPKWPCTTVHAWINRLALRKLRRCRTRRYFSEVGFPNFGIPQVRSKLPESGGSHPPSCKVRFSPRYPNFPLVLTFPICKCRNCRTANADRRRSENRHFSKFSNKLVFRQGWKQTGDILLVLLVPNFIEDEVLLKSSTPKQLPTFGLGLGSRSEKRIQISSFLELPDAEKYFPGSSKILLSRDILSFYGGRNFSSS